MRITIGVKSSEEAGYFLRNGADEIYFSLSAARGHRTAAFSSEADLIAAIRLARRLRRKTMLALNAVYPRENYPAILDHARRLTDKGLDGVIVRDPALLEYFADHDYRPYLVASVLCACFNSQTMEFYRDLGVRRFTLNSQVMPADAARMMAALPGVETVIFVPCLCLEANIEPYCFFPYPGGPSGACLHACTLRYKCGANAFRMVDTNLYYQADLLYDFHKLGVEWLKVSRQPNTPKLMAEFKVAVFLNRLLERGLGRAAFAASVVELIERLDMNKFGPSYDFKPFPGSAR
ncbi:MAG TPA: hypothetical protein DEQ38_05680 [Elusimicrobia bacterium]|nr:MAG: hypothetical protein A2089_13385 [Elusimicrobia bacterium GWD2_63_28]HCC47591.1 hypothetical protein [Elusimicrobiota bacterium]